MSIEELRNIILSKWESGESLFNIFEEIKQGYSREDAENIFGNFITIFFFKKALSLGTLVKG